MPKKKIVKKQSSPKAKKKVSFIPKNYHTLTPYLMVNDATAAIAFYQKVFGAKVILKMEQGTKRIVHAEVKIGDSKLMLADECSEMNALGPQAYGGTPVSFHLYVKNTDETVNKAVAAGAVLLRPIQNMFYGDRSGMITDPFGHKWNIATHIEDVTPAQLKKRMAQATKA